MRIVIITQYFPPDPPSWIPGGLARELAERGHEVRVLTTFPHYETGRIAHGYKQRLNHVERVGRVIVRRVPLFASHSSNPITRMLNYVSLAVSMRFARRFVRDAEVAYVYATPMTVADPARVWSNSLQLPFVLHVQDMWPESVTGSGILPMKVSRFVHTPLNWWLRRVYRAAASIVGIAPTMTKMLVERGAAADRAVTVFNWSDDADGANPQTGPRAWSGLRLVYAGNLGRMQDLETIIRALALVSDLPDVTFSVAGSGVMERELRELVDTLGVPNVYFLGRLAPVDVAALYENSDFQFVTLRDLPIFDGTIPSKFQAGIANALPAISTVRGDLRHLVEENELGFTAEPEDAMSLASAIRASYSTTPAQRAQYRARAREYYESAMSKSAAIDTIEDLLREARDGAKPPQITDETRRES